MTNLLRCCEVKGGRQSIDLVERKRQAAVEFYRERDCNYVILFKQELSRMGIMRRARRVGSWISELEKKGLVEGYAKGKSS